MASTAGRLTNAHVAGQICEICGDPSSSKILEKLKTRRGRKRRLDEFQEDETDRAERLGGWIQCATCCSSSHWVSSRWDPEEWRWLQSDEGFGQGCLPVATRHMFTKMDAELPADERIVKNGILPIRIGIRLAKCVHCDPRSKKAALTCTCCVCDKVKLENPVQEGEEKAFLFRCTSCKRAAHYEHSECRLAASYLTLTHFDQFKFLSLETMRAVWQKQAGFRGETSSAQTVGVIRVRLKS